jgi:hypothetical protein
VGVAPGDVPVLGADGKLDSGVMSPTLSEHKYAATTAANMIAGVFTTRTSDDDPTIGDLCILATGDVYKLTNLPYTTLASWTLISVPGDALLLINGHSGPSVVLTTSDVPQGTNLYYTEARATANYQTNFAASASTGLSDTANILYSTDTLILDCNPITT